MQTLLLAVVIAAPGLKDPPKKDNGIVGEWVVETMTLDGKPNVKPPFQLVYKFSSDGQWLAHRNGTELKTTPRQIQVDAKAHPQSIDVVYSPAVAGRVAAPTMLGIYKLDGDTLTLCFGSGGGERPTSFESANKEGVMHMVLKRVQRKD